MKRLVRVNSLGLAIPPQRLECLGEECPVAAKIGSCFVDEHHLYFPFAKFARNKLSREFRGHPFNRIRLPRCQHNSKWRWSVHKSKDETPMPSETVMHQFLGEAALLQQLGVLSVKSDGLLESSTKPADNSVIKRREDEWYETQAQLEQLIRLAFTECEVTLPFLLRQTEATKHGFGALLLGQAVYNS